MVRQIKSTLLLVPLLILLTGSRIYGAATYAGSTITIPADGDSPYTFSDIAEDIGDPSVFSYDAVSCIATCTAHLSISGTVHMGKVAADGSYNAGGNEEKLLMRTNATYAITINNGGQLIARGTEGTVGVRRTSADTLYNEITLSPQIYPKSFYVVVNTGGTITLHDTKFSWAMSSSGKRGINITGGHFDIQRCQLYSYKYYYSALYVTTYGYSYTNPVFRDNYIGHTGLANVYSFEIGGAGGSYANIQLINCEFASNSGGYQISDYYMRGLKIIDCKFSQGYPVSAASVGTYEIQIELRNCEFAGSSAICSLSGAGDVDTWLKYTYYLSAHVVNRRNLQDIDTGDNDITIEEKNGTNTIYKYAGDSWSSSTSSVSIGTGANGWTANPTNEGAIMLTEKTYKRISSTTSTDYYYYNLKVARLAASNRVYGAYDYYEQHGGNYITSVNEGGVTNDRCIGPVWFRQDAAAPNSEPLLNEPPTNGTWYVGIEPIPDGTIFSVY